MLQPPGATLFPYTTLFRSVRSERVQQLHPPRRPQRLDVERVGLDDLVDRKSTRLNSSHEWTSYAVFCLKKKFRRSEEHTSELQSRVDLVCRLLLEKKNLRQHANCEHPSTGTTIRARASFSESLRSFRAHPKGLPSWRRGVSGHHRGVSSQHSYFRS